MNFSSIPLSYDSNIPRHRSRNEFEESYIQRAHVEGADVVVWARISEYTRHRNTRNRLWYKQLHCTCILEVMFGRSTSIRALLFEMLSLFFWRVCDHTV
jgi:hypothetical protein